MPDDRPFIPGLQLSGLLYEEAVKPILEDRFPGLDYSAARLDGGSDVLGFDTPMSTDHGWGPKLSLLLRDADYEAHRHAVHRTLSEQLPLYIRGYPTHFNSPNLAQAGMEAIDHGPVQHGVEIHSVRSFFCGYLGIDPRNGMAAVDWLTLFEQRLRTIACGRIFYDGLGELAPARERLRWYPHDVWLYLLASQWRRISQEEAFMGRCGDAGDDLGSRLIASRLVWDLMRLCFLMERTYPPYSKWYGTAFARLDCGPALGPILERALAACEWKERELHLCQAYERTAEMHNALGITPPLPTEPSSYYDRPYRVIHAGEFSEAIRAAIAGPEIRPLPPIGSVNQFVDSTDVLDPHDRLRKLRVMFE